MTTYNGRIVAHVVAELVVDVIPNYCYNATTERFVPTLVSLIDPVQRPHAPKPIPAYMFGGKVGKRGPSARFLDCATPDAISVFFTACPALFPSPCATPT